MKYAGSSYAQLVWSRVMPIAKRDGSQMHLLSDRSQVGEDDADDAEFSSEPMPAAFGACLFLGLGLVTALLVALFW
jgi:hypothetical protein